MRRKKTKRIKIHIKPSKVFTGHQLWDIVYSDRPGVKETWPTKLEAIRKARQIHNYIYETGGTAQLIVHKRNG